ncbi:uncharacterized protein LOC133903885 [Phragmites australis]|uniref:uncharacterized protein LOC133903885 n=1 Tax=Phragmites australis TaxID=29695 RepID=UPI002D78FB67|nr:uncharacterized protein LOC133903885 [Phragmites australis]
MKVLVAVDDSDGNRHALAWVLDHLFPAADQQPRAALVHVHAQEPLRHIMYPAGPGPAVYGAPSMMESVRAAQAETARSLLDRAKRICHRRRRVSRPCWSCVTCVARAGRRRRGCICTCR